MFHWADVKALDSAIFVLFVSLQGVYGLCGVVTHTMALVGSTPQTPFHPTAPLAGFTLFTFSLILGAVVASSGTVGVAFHVFHALMWLSLVFILMVLARHSKKLFARWQWDRSVRPKKPPGRQVLATGSPVYMPVILVIGALCHSTRAGMYFSIQSVIDMPVIWHCAQRHFAGAIGAVLILPLAWFRGDEMSRILSPTGGIVTLLSAVFIVLYDYTFLMSVTQSTIVHGLCVSSIRPLVTLLVSIAFTNATMQWGEERQREKMRRNEIRMALIGSFFVLALLLDVHLDDDLPEATRVAGVGYGLVAACAAALAQVIIWIGNVPLSLVAPPAFALAGGFAALIAWITGQHPYDGKDAMVFAGAPMKVFEHIAFITVVPSAMALACATEALRRGPPSDLHYVMSWEPVAAAIFCAGLGYVTEFPTRISGLLCLLIMATCTLIVSSLHSRFALEGYTDMSWAPYDLTKGTRAKKKPRNVSTPHLQAYVQVGRTKGRSAEERADLAVDVFLPEDYEDGEELPTILHFTRFNRNWLPNRLGSFLMGDGFNMRSKKYLQKFVEHGYAFVSVDVRGTGASGGKRPFDFHSWEKADFPEVLDWVVAQEFCDGEVGCMGIGYDGMAAIHLGASNHPSLKAIAPMFAPLDVYRDLMYPGGVVCSGFLLHYGRYTYLLEQNEPNKIEDMPMQLNFQVHHMLNGVLPVNGDFEALEEHVAGHRDNFDFVSEILNRLPQSYDERITRLRIDPREFNPENSVKALNESNIPVYAIAGYFDSGMAGAASRLFRNLSPRRGHKLCLGPWTHAALTNSSPFASSVLPAFDLYAELLRFFDHHLKGTANGIELEHPVHYFNMGEEEWVPSHEFPPSDIMYVALVLADKFRLEWWQRSAPPDVTNLEQDSARDEYEIDESHTSPLDSRWNLVSGLYQRPTMYPDREWQGDKCYVYKSETLEEDLYICGTVVMNLVLSCPVRDCGVFVYLEEYDPTNGTATYITEGCLRAMHRRVRPTNVDPYTGTEHATAFRSYCLRDMEPLVPKKPTLMEIHFQPVAYTFAEGSRVRIAIAGVDVKNFELASNPLSKCTSFNIHHGPGGYSHLVLPVVPMRNYAFLTTDTTSAPLSESQEGESSAQKIKKKKKKKKKKRRGRNHSSSFDDDDQSVDMSTIQEASTRDVTTIDYDSHAGSVTSLRSIGSNQSLTDSRGENMSNKGNVSASTFQ